ncbi:MAG: nucleotidyltransferase domain-containing protein [Acidobacteria bacterium]|nr:nucleotidyltransferase domain-containing protein [Acidobacteriota bacterium]
MTMHPDYKVLLDGVVAACRRHYGERLHGIALYGSVARGTPTADSDVDLLVVADGLPEGSLPKRRDFDVVEDAVAPQIDALWKAGRHVRLSPILKTRAVLEYGTPLLLDMTEDARILYERDGYLTHVLECFRRTLRDLGARRIWRDELWYWDLKPDYRWGDVIELFPTGWLGARSVGSR